MPARSSVIWLVLRSAVFQNLPITWAGWCQRRVLWSDWPQEAQCFRICQSPEPVDVAAEFFDLIGPKKRNVSESANHLSRLMLARSSFISLAPRSTMFQNLPITWADWCQRWVLWSDWLPGRGSWGRWCPAAGEEGRSAGSLHQKTWLLILINIHARNPNLRTHVNILTGHYSTSLDAG